MNKIIKIGLVAVIVMGATLPAWPLLGKAETSVATTSTTCGVNLVSNGNFETPVVTNSDGWDIYASGTSGLGWSVSWLGSQTFHEGTTRPTTAQLEFIRSARAEWQPQSGSQFVELDTDWIGPESIINGEDASVKIAQTISTVAGSQYRISFYTAPRPYEPQNAGVNHPNTRLENKLSFSFGGAVQPLISQTGLTNTNTQWTKREYVLTATSSQTEIAFSELGVGDSYGYFLDNVSVAKDCGTTPPPPTNNPDPNPTSQPCGVNAIANGSFESPVVVVKAPNELWDIFPSAQNGIIWHADWLGSKTTHTQGGETISRPVAPQIELQRSHLGWQAQSGSQYTELDSDWNGPTGIALGEDANIRLYETLTTVPGATYTISFYASPRPGHPDNKMDVMWGGNKLATITASGIGNGNTVWTKYTYTAIATSAQTMVSFAEVGASDSYGMFLDTVTVERQCETLPVITCSPASQTVNIGQTANFTATGSNSTYTWSAPGANTTSGTGNTFATSYGTSGTKTVTVTSGGVSATCQAVVNQPVTPALYCNPSSQTVYVGNTATLTATGGNNSYTWSAPGANTTSGTGGTFATSYNQSGTKYVTVASGSLSAVCTVYVNNYTSGGSPTLTIEKLVRNATNNGSFSHSTTAKQGDLVDYKITIRNTGNSTATSVSLTDSKTNGYLIGNWTNFTVSRSYSGNLSVGNSLALGDLFSGQAITVEYRGVILSNPANAAVISNTAVASSSNASSVRDTATVTVGQVQGTNVILSYSKKAWNETKNQDAQAVTASREDYITYTLTVKNTGNAPQNNFVITDDLSGVLPLADMVDAGGGTVTGQVITYPSVTIPANGEVSKTFRVRVKYYLASNISYTMKNTYGNLVTVVINTPKTFTAPKTGADMGLLGGVGFASLSTFALAVIRRKRKLV